MGYTAPAWLMRLSGRTGRRSRPWLARAGPPTRGMASGAARGGRASAGYADRGGAGAGIATRATDAPDATDATTQATGLADAPVNGDGSRASGRGVERRQRRGQVRPARGSSLGARSRRVLLRVVLISLIIGIAGFALVEVRLKPTLKGLAEAKATEVGTTAVNDALSETSTLDIRYEDLMDWKTDGAGNIVAVQPNTGEINRIAASTTSRVQSVLRQIRDVTISLPLGQVFGSALLAGMGPWIKVSVVPIGVVTTTVTDTFEVAGINQLRHKIYLQLQANMKILVPLVSSNVTINASMPIAEAIILGDVPNFYVSTTGNPGGVLQGLTGIAP